MEFSEDDLKAIQHPSSIYFSNYSATSSAMLSMENDGTIMNLLNGARQIDGVIKPSEVEKLFVKFNVEIDGWGLGKPDFNAMAELFNEGIEPVEIPNIIIDSLRSAILRTDLIQLTVQLERDDYAKVNKVIEALGGKWNKKANGHVFKGKIAEDVVANYLETGKIDPVEKFGFFPTPKVLGRFLVNMGQLDSDSLILEPSAGLGNLAELCSEIVPANQITCYEIQEANCKVLREKGFSVEKTDFMSVEPKAIYSHVIMNPPFEKQQDIDHILHAYQFLKPGGTLCAIMSFGVTFRSNKKTTDFREFLEIVGGKLIENDPDAFKSSGTMARTVCIRLSKPESEIIDSPVCSFNFSDSVLPVELIEPDLCTSLMFRTQVLSVVQAGFDF